ncbi:MAG: hypothetical protein JRJ16_01405 [Deltaproteobacteria bacterium]|nr:hypothetical protein [Deltaproteobacteria bacterium]
MRPPASDSHFIYRVRVCRQCEEPACLEACPTEAFSVLDTGIVTIDSELCTGLRSLRGGLPLRGGGRGR